MIKHCPACGKDSLRVFYHSSKAPVHSVRLLKSREEALQFPTGEINLAHCQSCGFISNLSYHPELQDYSAEYESTQAYSPTFNSFAHKLALQLVDRYQLQNKDIIEIGCGQGEFLSLLCNLGNNHGTGFDPAYDPSRSAVSSPDLVNIVPDYYSRKYSDYQADLIVCKMTLEHIQDVAEFVREIRKSIGSRKNTTVFFQLPDVERVLEEGAFWDIYYEHCSYFSLGSVARLFRSQGFEVTGLWRDYGDQYLMIDAHPADGQTSLVLDEENDLLHVQERVGAFEKQIGPVLSSWKETVQTAVKNGQKVILWGSGSKGVAFLTTLGLCNEIEYTVDINPNKHNTYMAGTGQKVVSPDFLEDYRPDLVILMNPLYENEVREDLNKRGLQPKILSVGK